MVIFRRIPALTLVASGLLLTGALLPGIASAQSPEPHPLATRPQPLVMPVMPQRPMVAAPRPVMPKSAAGNFNSQPQIQLHSTVRRLEAPKLKLQTDHAPSSNGAVLQSMPRMESESEPAGASALKKKPPRDLSDRASSPGKLSTDSAKEPAEGQKHPKTESEQEPSGNKQLMESVQQPGTSGEQKHPVMESEQKPSQNKSITESVRAPSTAPVTGEIKTLEVTAPSVSLQPPIKVETSVAPPADPKGGSEIETAVAPSNNPRPVQTETTTTPPAGAGRTAPFVVETTPVPGPLKVEALPPLKPPLPPSDGLTVGPVVSGPTPGAPVRSSGGENNASKSSGGPGDFSSGINISPDIGARDIGSALSTAGQVVPGTAGTILKTGGEVLQSNSLGDVVVKATGIKGDGWADVIDGVTSGDKAKFNEGSQKLGDYLGQSAVTVGLGILIAALGCGALLAFIIGLIIVKSGLGNVIARGISAAFQWGAGKVFDLISAVGQTVVGQFIGGVVSTIVAGATAVVSAVVGFVVGVVGAVGEAISSAVGTVVSAIGDAASAVGGAIADGAAAVGELGGAIADFAGSVAGAVGDAFSAIGDAIVSFFSGDSGSTDQQTATDQQSTTADGQQTAADQQSTTSDQQNQDNTQKDDNTQDDQQQTDEQPAKDDSATPGASTKIGGESGGGDEAGAAPQESGGGFASQKAIDMFNQSFNRHGGGGTDYERESVGNVSPGVAHQDNYLTGGDSEGGGSGKQMATAGTRLTGSNSLDASNKLGVGNGPGNGTPGKGGDYLSGAGPAATAQDGTGLDVHLGDKHTDPIKDSFAIEQEKVQGAG